MPTTPPPRRHPLNRDRYLDLLIYRGVPEKMRPWYLRRVEAFLKALSRQSPVAADGRAGHGLTASAVKPILTRQRAVSSTGFRFPIAVM